MRRLFMCSVMILGAFLGRAEAEPCYEYVPVPASMDCNGGGTVGPGHAASDDFAQRCSSTAATVKKVQVACPAKWIQADRTKSQQQVCSAAGLAATSIDGQICLSGARRGTSGEGRESISFSYGTTGSQIPGGTLVQPIEQRINGGRGDVVRRWNEYFCNTPGTQFHSRGTDLVVAYACTAK